MIFDKTDNYSSRNPILHLHDVRSEENSSLSNKASTCLNTFMSWQWLQYSLLLRPCQPRIAPLPSRTILTLEYFEERTLPSIATTNSAVANIFRPIDEIGNNLAQPALGTAGTDLLRKSPAAYADGISTPSLASNSSARVISDLLNNQANPSYPTQDLNTLNGNSLTDFGYAWGQFLDHDMSLTPSDQNQTLQILADPNDPNKMGNQTFERSITDSATGTSTNNPAQQVNSVTSFLDLSQVYGSTAALADALRTHADGLLKTSPGNMLPYDNSTYFSPSQLALIHMQNDSGAVARDNLFVTGDVRGNENVELTVLQTLFVRNHNLIAGQLEKLHPTWTDEQLYQEARKLNIAEYQSITYKSYLPDLLGKNALANYTGYNACANPAIATEFSTVAFRFGHSLLDNEIGRQGNNGLDALPNDPAGADLSLATDFFDPNVLNPAGVVDPLTGHLSTDIGVVLKSESDGLAQANDLLVVNDVRNLLFGNSGQTDNGLDLIARDVERARDDGIGSYNQVRMAFGLVPVTSFAQISSNLQVQQKLQQAYGTVSRIDPFEGGLAETHLAGSDMGPLFTKIIADQFYRLRSGDRFFYLNESLNQQEESILNQGNSLTKIIEANTPITNLQADVFKFDASISGVVSWVTRGSLDLGIPLITVQLHDSLDNLLATTITDQQGHYQFNQESGISNTGLYSISLVASSGFKQKSPPPSSILISRGGQNVTCVNFTITSAQQGSSLYPSLTWPSDGTAYSDFDLVDALISQMRNQHQNQAIE